MSTTNFGIETPSKRSSVQSTSPSTSTSVGTSLQVGCQPFQRTTGPISGRRSPIRLQKTSLYLHDISDHILNQIEGSENLTLSLFSAVPIDLVAIQAFVSRAMLLSICTEASETQSAGVKNAIMIFFMTYGHVPRDKKCHSEHQTLFRFLNVARAIQYHNYRYRRYQYLHYQHFILALCTDC